ncbi:hypothetical protein MHOCP_07030 [Moorella humiferrea]|uniref:hypothetical protein n=1 Tax=Neomoorella humiferrea TaxID=676965 RepID=UPI0030CABC4A
MDAKAVANALISFIKKYKTEFYQMSSRHSQILEMAALMIAAEHYRMQGYNVTPKNLFETQFKVKTTARGYPWNFSWFEVSKKGNCFEIHSNLPVTGAYGKDGGIYVVDVGVTEGGVIPQKKPKSDWESVPNEHLITFIEAKKIVIYPMLLAQFIGIVHEIKPTFLDASCVKKDFVDAKHFEPTLVSIGYLHGVAYRIRKGYFERNFKINILPHFDIEIANLRSGKLTESPLIIKNSYF